MTELSSSSSDRVPSGDYVTLAGESWYRIRDVDQMAPFLMSIVSGSDHWLFIASNGGLTAGRGNPDFALFPYETEDKLIAHRDQSGGLTRVESADFPHTTPWLPFSDRCAGQFRLTRSLSKNINGDKLLFEEVNHDLGLTWRCLWRTGDRFGFVRTVSLHNHADQPHTLTLLDGVQNVLPAGATSTLQTTMSSLLNAYKRNELEPQSGLAFFTLSATLTDQAEPSESLMTTVVWQVGLDSPVHLLTTDQIARLPRGQNPTPEHDSCGKPGAYLLHTPLTLAPDQTHTWHIVADVQQDHAAVARLLPFLQQEPGAIVAALEEDIARNSAALLRHVAAADGLQQTAQQATSAHHYANVMFNVMRGGIFVDGYRLRRDDLSAFVQVRSWSVSADAASWLAALPDSLTIGDLHARAAATGNPDLIRLCYEYLPLTFSRRHGDPSRPWNHFSINLRQPDGSPRLDYQGNWRDIFQNWEALATAFPAFLPGMIARFLNATSGDGYNPYRINRDGIDWEVPEPENPWSNIGYWSDHQIIYLQKLLELAAQMEPEQLRALGNRPIFATANIPYRIKPYPELLADWSNTITFDHAADGAIAAAVATAGSDARLHRDGAGRVVHVTLTEKLLTLLLAKLTNLVPEGGIWMNTQRPEWNDANNAIVGKGMSVVTTAYLRRFLRFWQEQLVTDDAEFAVSPHIADLFSQVQAILLAGHAHLQSGFSDEARRAIMDSLGSAASDFRARFYADGLPGSRVPLSGRELGRFLTLALAYVEQTLRVNRRPDRLWHAYNILHLGQGTASIEPLYPMLEGQVAILSAELLTPQEVLELLHALRHSELYRADQHSYMLYPWRALPGFLRKNHIPAQRLADSPLAQGLAAAGDSRLLIRDRDGVWHFNGRFRNANDVARVLDTLAREPEWQEGVSAERRFILDLFEETFNHRAFTGRSGTFFAYEGLGSIYWHMVAKLLLAVQECYRQAVDAGAEAPLTSALAAAYYDIRAGIGFNKTPDVYGAFPTDPYSHTPWGRGAQQPGMTGQVKEEILTRQGELGVSLQRGLLCFAPTLLRPAEFMPAESVFAYVNVAGNPESLPLPPDSLAFTFCQVPVICQRSTAARIEVVYENGRMVELSGHCLDQTMTRHILNRDGQITQLRLSLAV